jgi:hypothetical protein
MPTHKKAALNLPTHYTCSKTGRPQKPLIKTVLKDTTVNAVAWNRLGFTNFNLGLYKDALNNFAHALTNKPVPALQTAIHVRVARIYGKLNQPDSVLARLDRAVALGYANLMELDSLPEFKAVKTRPAFTALRQKVNVAAYPCLANPRTHDFDFWIGEWNVYQTGTNYLVGYSQVQSISGGCALLENWTAANTTHNGKSINYYNADTGKWKQDWMGSDGIAQHYYDGEFKKGVMSFIYNTVNSGKKTMGHFLFYSLNKNTIRQYQDISTDGGKTYQVSYDFTYKRKVPR